MTCEDIYFEALTTMEIFYDNEIAALISYATDMGMNKTEYCGIPTLYPVIQQYFFRQFIDKIITGEMKIDFFQKPHKKRQPLSIGERMSQQQRDNFITQVSYTQSSNRSFT